MKGKIKMLCYYNSKTAVKCGINSAMIAGYLWIVSEKYGKIHNNKKWLRCSEKMLTAVFPFLGRTAVHNAVKRLENSGIVIRKRYNENPFDRTFSFAFTDYGAKLMEEEKEW